MISLKIDDLNWSKQNGLIPVVVQDNLSKDILMVAYANKEALEKTCTTRLAHFWSRSKQKLWLKGETSGNTQKIIDVLIDCDEDTILYLVESNGPACHTGNRSCFFRNID
jgi:phosphoribosyl-AMP cyclohydrolase